MYLHFFRDRHKVPLSGMPFSALIQKIAERYKGLNLLYGNQQAIEVNNPEGVEVCDSRFSIVRLIYPPGGNAAYYDCFKGYMKYSGHLQPHLDLLEAGSRIGIGQLTPAGLSRFTIGYE